MTLVTKTVRQPSGDHFGPLVSEVTSYIFDQTLGATMRKLEPRIRWRLKDPILWRISGHIS